MNYINHLVFWFQQLSGKRQFVIVMALFAIIALTGSLSIWIVTPSYAVLLTQLEEQDAQRIIHQLEEDHISYQLRQDGSEILIDKELIAKTRLKLMGSDVPFSGTIGFELFDKNDWNMTDFSQKINYQRALQGELERTISALDEIRQVRVHLVIPEQHLFAATNNTPKAAITLHLKTTLKPQQVRSIQQLVSASVAHLKTKDVVIVDQFGNSLSSVRSAPDQSQFLAKKTIEHYLQDKVNRMLQKIFPQQDYLISIDASINHDQLEREQVKPQAHAHITHEKQSTQWHHNKEEKSAKKPDTTMERTYQLGSEKELFKRAKGTIERLSISVALPEQTPAKIQNQIQHLVENSVGFNAKRGDTISIAALINTTSQQATKPTMALIPDHGKVQKMGITPNSLAVFRIIDHPLLVYGLLLFIGIASTGCLVIRRIRHKKRQVLLLELTQWLHHHG